MQCFQKNLIQSTVLLLKNIINELQKNIIVIQYK